MFGDILLRKPEVLIVRPVAITGPMAKSATDATKKLLRAVTLVLSSSTGGTVDLKFRIQRQSLWENDKPRTLATVKASELRPYGKTVLGFDRIRLQMSQKDRAAVLVWLDEVMTFNPEPPEPSYVIVVRYPIYGSRDEVYLKDKQLPGVYQTYAEAKKALRKVQQPHDSDADVDYRIVTEEGREPYFPERIIWDVPDSENPAEDMLFGLGGLSNTLFNSQRRYYLRGEVWQGKSVVQSNQRFTLERFDAGTDSSFFLYFLHGGLVGRVHERTVAKPNKWVSFKKDKYEVRVLRADLLQALEALA